MEKREWKGLIRQLLQEMEITDEKYCNDIVACLKEEDDKKYLAIEIDREKDKGVLKKLHLSFDLGTALVLLEELCSADGGNGSIEKYILFIVKVLSALIGYEKTSFDDMQVMIINALYQMRKEKRRNPLEDDLFEYIQKEHRDEDIDKSNFNDALSELVKLKCIEIVEGSVELKEKVRYS